MKKRNQQKWNKWIAGVTAFLLLLAVLPVQNVQAASATITLSTEEEEIHVGDTVEIKLTIRADATIGDFEAFLSYDDEIFEFYSSVPCIKGAAGSLRIYDVGASPSSQERTYRMYFRAVAQGECEVALYDRPVVYCYTDGKEMSVTGVSSYFSVLPSSQASGNNRLSALHLVDNRTETVVLTPEFKPEQKEYYATVRYESDTVIVSALAEDTEKADVKVVGGRNLNTGNNEILITVTAEDGSTGIYKVHVYRAETPEKPAETEPSENTQKPVQTGITLTEEEAQVFVSEYHTYTVCEKPEDFVIPDGYVQSALMMDNITIPAYVKQGENPEEFLLLVLKNDAGEINWYRYDRIEQTLQRVNEEEYVITQNIQNNEGAYQAAIQEYEAHQSMLTFAVALLFGICLVLLTVILWLCIRRKNRG